MRLSHLHHPLNSAQLDVSLSPPVTHPKRQRASVHCWHRFILNAFLTTYLISYFFLQIFTAGGPMEDQTCVHEPKTDECCRLANAPMKRVNTMRLRRWENKREEGQKGVGWFSSTSLNFHANSILGLTATEEATYVGTPSRRSFPVPFLKSSHPTLPAPKIHWPPISVQRQRRSAPPPTTSSRTSANPDTTQRSN